jgi:hypothetical protein
MDKWISVSERLPNNDRNVLTYWKSKVRIVDSYFHEEPSPSTKGHWLEARAWGDEVTHWMELPKPPEPQTK